MPAEFEKLSIIEKMNNFFEPLATNPFQGGSWN
jgi:hypothetical protein